MKFWTKAERVVNYKAKTVADARKKEVMDKHLSFLVDQTQRYSSMLADRLKTGELSPEAIKGLFLQLGVLRSTLAVSSCHAHFLLLVLSTDTGLFIQTSIC